MIQQLVAMALGCVAYVVPQNGSSPQSRTVEVVEAIQAIDILLGQRQLDEDFWETTDEQPMLGLQFSSQCPGAPVGFEIGVLASRDDDDLFVSGLGTLELETRV